MILLLAGFLLVSALAEESGKASVSKPAMATLELQSNFDYSLTRKEFRVYYSGLGEGFKTTEEFAYIKIYKMAASGSDATLLHTFSANKDTKKVYQLALEDAGDGKYEVEVCAGQPEICSQRNPALTDVKTLQDMKITCKRVDAAGNFLTDPTTATFEELFVGPTDQDWIETGEFTNIEKKVNDAIQASTKEQGNYKTDYSKLKLSANPTYKHDSNKGVGVFYAALRFNIARYKKLFDAKIRVRGTPVDGTYAHPLCERKYLLSAHAHIVNQSTKEVEHRFKTTLFLSEGGKQMYVLAETPENVHVEMTHEDVTIPVGQYNLWITFCATEKDAIESTFCLDPIIKNNFQVTHE